MKSSSLALFGAAYSVGPFMLAACGSDAAFVETQSLEAGAAKPATEGVGTARDVGSADAQAAKSSAIVPAGDPLVNSVTQAAAAPVLASSSDSASASASDSATASFAPPSAEPAVEAENPADPAPSNPPAPGSDDGSGTVSGGGRQGSVPEDVKAPPADSVSMNVKFSQLRGDASYTNCLDVSMNNGENVKMGCNKDGTLQKDVAVKASPAPFCNMISLKFMSQGNVLVDSRSRTNMDRIRIVKVSDTVLEIGLEDSTDADYNDYFVRIDTPASMKYFVQGTDVTNCD